MRHPRKIHDNLQSSPGSPRWPLLLLAVFALTAAGLGWRFRGASRPPAPRAASIQSPADATPPEASHEVVARICGTATRTLRRRLSRKDLWPHEVERGFNS